MTRTNPDPYALSIPWHWEEAFDKFGFGDGDGPVHTPEVVLALGGAGYAVEIGEAGLHNAVIESITLNGIEQIPASAALGYDDPRCYLPAAIIQLLDERFPNDLPRLV